MTRPKPLPGRAAVVGKDIVIRLPIANIPFAVTGLVDWLRDRLPMDYPIRITDEKAFAKYVCLALNKEEEDGTTPVHELFDAAFWAAAEDGAEGCETGRFNDAGDAVYEDKPRRKRGAK